MHTLVGLSKHVTQMLNVIRAVIFVNIKVQITNADDNLCALYLNFQFT